MRKYKTGTGWCVWRWSEVDSEYITRLHLIKTPWFAVCLHWLHKPDPEPHRHDHPVSFFSIILHGSYVEFRNRLFKRRVWFNYIKASLNDTHRIVSVKPNTITLCFMGPKRREWGFHTPNGWVYWRDYYLEQRKRG
jgi:hypothetical protein